MAWGTVWGQMRTHACRVPGSSLQLESHPLRHHHVVLKQRPQFKLIKQLPQTRKTKTEHLTVKWARDGKRRRRHYAQAPPDPVSLWGDAGHPPRGVRSAIGPAPRGPGVVQRSGDTQPQAQPCHPLVRGVLHVRVGAAQSSSTSTEPAAGRGHECGSQRCPSPLRPRHRDHTDDCHRHALSHRCKTGHVASHADLN